MEVAPEDKEVKSTLSHLIKGLAETLRATDRRGQRIVDGAELMSMIQQTSTLLSTQALVMLTCLFLVPGVITFSFFFAFVPVYRLCNGCDIFAPLIITCLVQVLVPTLFLLNLIRLTLWTPADLYGIKVRGTPQRARARKPD